MVKNFYVCFRLVTYVILFGIQIRPFFAKTMVSAPQEKPSTPKHKPVTKVNSKYNTYRQ